MITERMKDFLAIANDLSNERYVDCVNEAGREKYSTEEECARLRKVVKLLADLMVINHPDIIDASEYKELIEYYNDFENIKANTKNRLGIEDKNTTSDAT